MIMQRLMDDFLSQLEDIYRRKGTAKERVVGLQIFARRLIHLNNEKFQILVKRYQQNNILFDTMVNKEEYDQMQQANFLLLSK